MNFAEWNEIVKLNTCENTVCYTKIAIFQNKDEAKIRMFYSISKLWRLITYTRLVLINVVRRFADGTCLTILTLPPSQLYRLYDSRRQLQA